MIKSRKREPTDDLFINCRWANWRCQCIAFKSPRRRKIKSQNSCPVAVAKPLKEPTTQDCWPESHPAGAALQTGEVAQRLAAGREGEARVRALFLAELPTGTWVLNNLLVPGLMGDIDLLVVGANGVFLPEIKTWVGTMTCASDGRSWSRVRAGR